MLLTPTNIHSDSDLGSKRVIAVFPTYFDFSEKYGILVYNIEKIF